MEKPIISLNKAVIQQKANRILEDVTFDVHPGEFVYIIGKTGSGKSSLLKTLYADLWLEEGEGHVVDFSLPTLNRKEIPFLRRKMGIVFQDFQLLGDRTVEKNLLFFMSAMGWTDSVAMKNRMMEVLDRVQLSHLTQKMPHQISGGEQQRIAIARALLNQPSLLLADEPTGNLDPDTSKEIMRLFMEINETLGMAVVMATHDFALIEKFPFRTLHCANGKVQEITKNL
ncbi:MAG: cell division ATP-binding protein FtsE [Spirosomataceae bacterium]